MQICLDRTRAEVYTDPGTIAARLFAMWSIHAPAAYSLFCPRLAKCGPAKPAVYTERTQVPGLSHRAHPMPLCSTRRRRGIVITLTDYRDPHGNHGTAERSF